MYRDGANYKNHGEVIMRNPEKLSLVKATEQIQAKLIDEMYFYAHELGVMDLHFPHWNDKYDHSWHEFVSLDETHELPTTRQSLNEFINSLKKQL